MVAKRLDEEEHKKLKNAKWREWQNEQEKIAAEKNSILERRRKSSVEQTKLSQLQQV